MDMIKKVIQKTAAEPKKNVNCELSILNVDLNNRIEAA